MQGLGVLKEGDFYRQKVRLHALKFGNRRLPENQAAMRAEQSGGLAWPYEVSEVRAGCCQQGSYVNGIQRVPTEEQREMGSVFGFK